MKKIIIAILIFSLLSCGKSIFVIPSHFRIYWELHQYEDESKPVVSFTYYGIVDSTVAKTYDTTLVPIGCTVRDSARWVLK